MKKKLLVLVTAAILTVSQGAYVFGAPSPGTGSGVNTGGSVTNNGDNQDPERHSSSSSSTTSSSSSSTQTGSISGAAVGTDAVRVNEGASTGTSSGSGSSTSVQMNERGQAVIGEAALEFATGEAATAGLPNSVTASIAAINRGESLDQAVSSLDLSGYAALTQSNALVIKDAQTNQVREITTRTPIYVPNLMSSQQGIAVLIYDNATNQWRLVQPSQIDYAAKTIYVDFTGSSTFIPVYRVG